MTTDRNRMTRRSAHRAPRRPAALLPALTAALLSGAIFTIPAGNARAAAACTTPPPVLAKFKAAVPPGPAMTAPFQDAGGAGVTIKQLSGKSGTVVNLWATWCAPCTKEMPQLDALKGDLAKDGIVVLAISQDRGGLGQVKPFYDKQGFENLSIHLDPNTAVARSAKVRGLPTTILYAGDGREMGRLEGVAEWDDPAAADFIRACLASGAGG